VKMILPILCLVSFSSWCQAQTHLVERVVEVQTSEANPAVARPQLMNQAAEKVSEDLIKEIIGEAKFSRNRALIQAKIMKRSASFLPFSKAGELTPQENNLGFKMNVTTRANVDDLQKLLLENGLFYDTEATPTVLPVVKWVDRLHSQQFGWWMSHAEDDVGKASLSKQSRALESALQTAFLKSGFYAIRPQALRYRDLLSPGDQSETVAPDSLTSWSQVWSAPVILQGQVQLSSASGRSDAVLIDVRLTALQTTNGRIVAQVGRQFETESGAFENVVDKKLKEVFETLPTDLANQLLEAWKQGAINSQLYQIKVLGRLNIPAQEAFKEALREKVREVKSVRERLIAGDEIIYEIDSSVAPAEIAKRLADGFEVQGIKLNVDQASEKDLTLHVLK